MRTPWTTRPWRMDKGQRHLLRECLKRNPMFVKDSKEFCRTVGVTNSVEQALVILGVLVPVALVA